MSGTNTTKALALQVLARIKTRQPTGQNAGQAEKKVSQETKQGETADPGSLDAEEWIRNHKGTLQEIGFSLEGLARHHGWQWAEQVELVSDLPNHSGFAVQFGATGRVGVCYPDMSKHVAIWPLFFDVSRSQKNDEEKLCTLQ